MNWVEYYTEFRRRAKQSGHDEVYCDKWLQYAKALYNKRLPIIYNQEHLCLLLGYREEYVFAASNSPELFYRDQ